MCTLTIAWQMFESTPVLVAANRDEALDRPSVPPDVVATDPVVVAPRDEEAGGTWIGVNEHGVFVGVTNRWVEGEGVRSRGLLVRDALACRSAAEAAAVVESAVADDEYAGFNLVVADAADCVLFEYDGALARTALDPGVHVVVNVGYDDTFFVPSRRPDVGERQAANAKAARRELTVRPDETADDWLERAAAVLADHEFGLCIHGDGFGTRSSSLVSLGETTSYRFANGPPCETDYRSVSLPATLSVEGHF